jgi:hypothetical protein
MPCRAQFRPCSSFDKPSRAFDKRFFPFDKPSLAFDKHFFPFDKPSRALDKLRGGWRGAGGGGERRAGPRW